MRRIALMMILGFAVIVTAVMPAASQTPGQKPAFEVASIKPSKSGGIPFSAINTTASRFTASNATVKALLGFAYGTTEKPFSGQYQISGGPDWANTDKFDVQGKPPENNGPISEDQLRRMVQSLLEERFQLKVHWETRELPIYNLIVAKGGPKLTLSEDQTPPSPAAVTGQRGTPSDPSGKQPRGTIRFIRTSAGIVQSWSAEPLSSILIPMKNQADRLIIDKTGLTELYDAQLQPSDDAPTPGGAATPATPLSLASIQEQLGLKLESGKAPVDVLVIDSVQRPSEN